MYYEITITAVADRDESCNLLTLTERHIFRISQTPNVEQVKELLKAHKVKFLDMWPHNRQAAPTLVPIDVTIKQYERERP